MEFFEIVLQLVGAIAIIVAGYWMQFGGALGSVTAMFISGWLVYGFGVFTTVTTIFLSVFKVDPNNTAVYGISIFVAVCAVFIHYRKLYVSG